MLVVAAFDFIAHNFMNKNNLMAAIFAKILNSSNLTRIGAGQGIKAEVS